MLAREEECDEVVVKGWVRTKRDSKQFSFLEINDGSCMANIQVIADVGIPGSEDLPRMGTGAAVEVVGDPRVKPSEAPLATVMAESWLPPTSARVPALTAVLPV